jgi:hypothetical protein
MTQYEPMGAVLQKPQHGHSPVAAGEDVHSYERGVLWKVMASQTYTPPLSHTWRGHRLMLMQSFATLQSSA